VVKLLELLAPIEMDGDQSLNILGLQAADHLVVVVLDAKHAIDFVLRRRRRWAWRSVAADILVRVIGDVPLRRHRQAGNLGLLVGHYEINKCGNTKIINDFCFEEVMAPETGESLTIVMTLSLKLFS